MQIPKKKVNLNRQVRLDPDGAQIDLGRNGLVQFNRPKKRGSADDNGLGFDFMHEQAMAFDFRDGSLVFNEADPNWIWTTFEVYWRTGGLVPIDDLNNRFAPVSAANPRWRCIGRIFELDDSSQFNTLSQITIPYRIFQQARSEDDITFTDITNNQPIDWLVDPA